MFISHACSTLHTILPYIARNEYRILYIEAETNPSKYVPRFKNMSAMAQIIAWRPIGDKRLSQQWYNVLLACIRVIRVQVQNIYFYKQPRVCSLCSECVGAMPSGLIISHWNVTSYGKQSTVGDENVQDFEIAIDITHFYHDKKPMGITASLLGKSECIMKDSVIQV